MRYQLDERYIKKKKKKLIYILNTFKFWQNGNNFFFVLTLVGYEVINNLTNTSIRIETYILVYFALLKNSFETYSLIALVIHP